MKKMTASDEQDLLALVRRAAASPDYPFGLVIKEFCEGLPAEVRKRNEQVIQMAQDEHQKDGAVEVDDLAVVSEGADNGAYVLAWVWVGYEGTEFDKEGGDAGE